MSMYDEIRSEMDQLIDSIQYDPDLYSLAVAARMIFPQEHSNDEDAAVLIEECLAMIDEIWEKLADYPGPSRAAGFCAIVKGKLTVLLEG